MSVFRRPDQKAKGEGWTVQWREAGRIRTMTTRTKTAADRIHERKREDERLRRAGVINRQDEAFAKAEGRALANHIADFQKDLELRKVTPREVGQKVARLNKLRDHGNLFVLSDVTAERIQAAIKSIEDEGFKLGRSKKTYSLEALNKYILAAKQFGRWCSRTNRTKGNVLDGLVQFNARTDRRHERRVFTDVEIAMLLTPEKLYEDKTTPCAISREDRAMLYRVAMLTGFRASELRSLTPQSFKLDELTAEVAAAFSKHRRTDVQPLPMELVEKLKPWLAAKPKGKPLWAVAQNMAKVLRRDLATLGIPYKVDGKHGDFHALRHTYISRLVASGMNPKDAQTLARHSTIVLTMDRYSHVDRNSLQEKLAMVPNLEK